MDEKELETKYLAYLAAAMCLQSELSEDEQQIIRYIIESLLRQSDRFFGKSMYS